MWNNWNQIKKTNMIPFNRSFWVSERNVPSILTIIWDLRLFQANEFQVQVISGDRLRLSSNLLSFVCCEWSYEWSYFEDWWICARNINFFRPNKSTASNKDFYRYPSNFSWLLIFTLVVILYIMRKGIGRRYLADKPPITAVAPIFLIIENALVWIK